MNNARYEQSIAARSHIDEAKMSRSKALATRLDFVGGDAVCVEIRLDRGGASLGEGLVVLGCADVARVADDRDAADARRRFQFRAATASGRRFE